MARQSGGVTIPEPLIKRLQSARSVTVFTGAGVSAESGVPTFRDAQTGYWSKFRADVLATPRAFKRDPKLVWKWYNWRSKLVAAVQPNPGHFAIAQMESLFSRFSLITQNVDGLHQRAGSKNVVELHGNLTKVKCFDENTMVERWNDDGQVPPKCPRCGGFLRPAVVWFEEELPKAEWRKAVDAIECDLFFTVGTSALVFPAAALPSEAAKMGSTVVEVNPTMTDFTEQAHFHLGGPSGEVMPLIVEAMKSAKTAG